MATATQVDPAASPPAVATTTDDEQLMLLRAVSWAEYLALRDAYDRPSLRMTYCEGVLELMSPSMTHDRNKAIIARLVETYAFLRRLRLQAYGGPTFRKEDVERGLEPDACYCVGRSIGDDDFPDIALEVIHRSPLLDKLDVYRGLGVPEVWLFRKGAFELNRLDGDRYVRIERSRLLPELDFAMLAALATRGDQLEALLELERLLATTSGRP